MIVLTCEQGSREWVEARLGRPTASQFSRIVTPGGKLSASRNKYAGELLSEWALGESPDPFNSEWTERGRVLEPIARRYYGFMADIDPEQVGFCYRDDRRDVGASPDALVGGEGLLELKVPMPSTHLIWLASGELPRTHTCQLQGQLWVTGRRWVDFLSWHPDLPPFLLRVIPDPLMQAAFDAAVPAFIAELEAGKERLEELGVQPWRGYVDPDDPFGEGETVTQPHGEANRKGSIASRKESVL